MTGEEFLNKLYKDLILSKEVQHTAKGTKNKDEALKRYLDRLERIQNHALNNNHIEFLKKLYHEKYIIKESELPQNIDRKSTIQTLKDSLDKWLDHLLDKNTKYPMWAKYWVFQGILKIGTYNEQTGTYQKRTKKTLSPFIEPNSEVISKCISIVTEFLQGKEPTNKELEQLIENGNFAKLYITLLKTHKKDLIDIGKKEDGIWLIYHYETEQESDNKEKEGIEPEYLKLYNSLQGYNTGWCTAGDKFTAKDQICGIKDYLGGDFYVYYTKDTKGEYKIPRIAIRMEKEDNKQTIAEIRGIGESENLEIGLESIVEQKLKSLPNLSKQDIKKYLKIIDNLRKITELNKKKEPLTPEELKFLHKKIKLFGYENDKRLETLRRNNIIKDSNLALEIVKENALAIQYVDPNIPNYKEIAITAVNEDVWAANWVDEKVRNTKEFFLPLVKRAGRILVIADENLKKDRDIVLAAVKNDSMAILAAAEELKKDKEIALATVTQNKILIRFFDISIQPYLLEELSKLNSPKLENYSRRN